LKNFVQENYKDNGKSHFLPKWLQEVVNVIDNKIQGSSKSVSVNNEATES